MTKVAQKINNSPTLRWTVLGLVSVTMMMGYIVAKQMSPLQHFLESDLGWTSSEFGVLAGSRGFFNVFLLMLFVGGIILDKTGVRFAGVLSCVLMLGGTAIDYYAIAFMDPSQVLDINLQWIAYTDPSIKLQVLVAALGFATFGVGYELCGITVSKVVVKWFTGKEMALAMGIQVALARLGTGLALAGAPMLAVKISLSTPILIGLFSVGVGLIIYLIYCSIDRKNESLLQEATTDDDEKFHFKDMGATMKNPGFWLITLLCLLYYSALYPFLDFATKLMISKYGVEPSFAGLISSILPFTSIVLTPLFGGMYDKIVSNIQEIKSRKGKIISVVTDGDTTVKNMSDYCFVIPDTRDCFVPMLAVIPLQLLAYYIATAKGRNVDQPRNLAKSVTVE